MQNHLTVGVIGATGYTGGELCRLLLGHPQVGDILPTARSGDLIERVHPNLLGSGLAFLPVDDLKQRVGDLDAVFVCMPSGEAMRLAPWFLGRGVRVIDLGADFRFGDPYTYSDVYGIAHAAPHLLSEAAYGITELYREDIAKAHLVANPGCYVITAVLAMAPVLRAGWADLDALVHINAVNGTTGAGSKPVRPIMHAQALGSMLPYSLEGHRHGPELEACLAEQARRDLSVDFNTAHGNFARGIHAQVNLTVHPDHRHDMSRDKLLSLLKGFYGAGSDGEFFVRVVDGAKSGERNAKEYEVYPRLSGVIGSNFCHLGADYDSHRGIVKLLAVTDNLIKGAAGSAIQNMNVMLGLKETTALTAYGL